MLLAESTVDAETAQSIDGTKMLVDDGCDLGVNGSVEKVGVAPDPKRVGPASWNLEYG